ncbi:hypothetical protein M0805_001275, partial [Coniferiporia weirii]
MPDFYAAEPCPSIPDDLTAAQFILDAHHPERPSRSGDIPWLVDDASARRIGFEEVRSRTYGLANAMHSRWGIGALRQFKNIPVNDLPVPSQATATLVSTPYLNNSSSKKAHHSQSASTLQTMS